MSCGATMLPANDRFTDRLAFRAGTRGETRGGRRPGQRAKAGIDAVCHAIDPASLSRDPERAVIVPRAGIPQARLFTRVEIGHIRMRSHLETGTSDHAGRARHQANGVVIGRQYDRHTAGALSFCTAPRLLPTLHSLTKVPRPSILRQAAGE
jgi:hypothetical protein